MVEQDRMEGRRIYILDERQRNRGMEVSANSEQDRVTQTYDYLYLSSLLRWVG